MGVDWEGGTKWSCGVAGGCKLSVSSLFFCFSLCLFGVTCEIFIRSLKRRLCEICRRVSVTVLLGVSVATSTLLNRSAEQLYPSTSQCSSSSSFSWLHPPELVSLAWMLTDVARFLHSCSEKSCPSASIHAGMLVISISGCKWSPLEAWLDWIDELLSCGVISGVILGLSLWLCAFLWDSITSQPCFSQKNSVRLSDKGKSSQATEPNINVSVRSCVESHMALEMWPSGAGLTSELTTEVFPRAVWITECLSNISWSGDPCPKGKGDTAVSSDSSWSPGPFPFWRCDRLNLSTWLSSMSRLQLSCSCSADEVTSPSDCCHGGVAAKVESGCCELRESRDSCQDV